jgi:hypothetical protein
MDSSRTGVRTYVRMGRPYRPERELEAHLARGELDFAIAVARTMSDERGRPLELEAMLGFLPVVAVQRPAEFDVWALRWLQRWCEQLRGQASIDDAIEIAASLAEIPVDPERALARLNSSHAD